MYEVLLVFVGLTLGLNDRDFPAYIVDPGVIPVLVHSYMYSSLTTHAAELQNLLSNHVN